VKMLDLLLQQRNKSKIPAGIPENIACANKTGDTDSDQHDIAIVFGENTDYILCVLSEGCKEGSAVTNIRSLSDKIYKYMDLFKRQNKNDES
ncbi:MAG: serine hydrolase, partial [Blautia sp.]|nr:serine hydrolase [Blautia sp.]